MRGRFSLFATTALTFAGALGALWYVTGFSSRHRHHISAPGSPALPPPLLEKAPFVAAPIETNLDGVALRAPQDSVDLRILVVNSSGSPLQGTWVTASLTIEDVLEPSEQGSARGETGLDGIVTFPQSDSADMPWILAEKIGYAPRLVNLGQTLEGVRETSPTVIVTLDRMVEVTVRVLSIDKAPIPDVAITAQGTWGTEALQIGKDSPIAAVLNPRSHTDASGIALVSLSPSTSYTVTAFHPDFMPFRGELAYSVNAPTFQITLLGVLVAGARILGIPKDSARIIASAHASPHDMIPGWGKLERQWTSMLEKELGTENVCWFFAPLHDPGARYFEDDCQFLGRGTQTSVTLGFRPIHEFSASDLVTVHLESDEIETGTVVVQFTDNLGDPTEPSVQWSLWKIDGGLFSLEQFSAQPLADSVGLWRWTALPPGKYQIHHEAPFLSKSPIEKKIIEVVPGDTVRIDWAEPNEARTRVRIAVHDTAGRPVSNYRASLKYESGSVLVGDGPVPSGACTLVVTAPGYEKKLKELVIQDGVETSVDVVVVPVAASEPGDPVEQGESP